MLSMFSMLNIENIYPAYVSKHNWNRKKQFILLMILNGEICEAKFKDADNSSVKLSALSRGITSITVIFIIWIAFIPLEQKKLKLHKKCVKIKIFVM